MWNWLKGSRIPTGTFEMPPLTRGRGWIIAAGILAALFVAVLGPGLSFTPETKSLQAFPNQVPPASPFDPIGNEDVRCARPTLQIDGCRRCRIPTVYASYVAPAFDVSDRKR